MYLDVIKIRYAQIRELDISNGSGIGVSLFVQGCPFHCKNCFNIQTWEYNDGNVWDINTKNKFLNIIDKMYVVRVSLLGGEPLYFNNVIGILELCKDIKSKYPDIYIWIWTGFKYEDLKDEQLEVLKYTDVLVDGQYIEELKDFSLKFKGSSNQRIIDVQRSLQQNKIILYDC